MTEVAANYNINMTEVTANNMKMEGFQSAEVDAILNTVGDDKIWKSMEEFKFDEKTATGDMNMIMLGDGHAPVVVPRIPGPEPVNPNDPRAIEIAQWAVAEYNRLTGSNRMYVRLLGGVKWKLVIGTVYALRILNRDDKHMYISRAVVVENTKTKSRRLVFWRDEIVN